MKATNLSAAYGDRILFDIDALELHRGDKIGLVGHNGAGKTTLLDILSGLREPEGGTVDIRGTVACIRQEQDKDLLMESFERAKGKNYKPARSFERGALSSRPSGGEMTRAAIADALDMKADILLADEPTTNLDARGVESLQAELKRYRGGLILISHDRELLDEVCNEIWALEGGDVRKFPGNYTAWTHQRDLERAHAASEYETYRREKKRLETAARKMSERARGMLKAPARMSASEARLCANKEKAQVSQSGIYAKSGALSHRAEMLEVRERPRELPEIRMALGASHPLRSQYAIRAEGLNVSFDDGKILFKNAAFEVTTNKRTILAGDNGSGKTTLLEMIRSGAPGIKISPGLRLGYFSQNHETLDLSKSVLENARALSALPEHEVRTILARLEIKDADVHKPCGILSGGERAKTAFARLFASELNALILDEPTNHIDLYTTDALENLLLAWRGTLLLVTHDRRLANRLGERFLFIEDRKISTFEGTMREYQTHQAERTTKDDLSTHNSNTNTSIQAMRMAEIGARIDAAKTPQEKEKWTREWQALLKN